MTESEYKAESQRLLDDLRSKIAEINNEYQQAIKPLTERQQRRLAEVRAENAKKMKELGNKREETRNAERRLRFDRLV